jgi:hypothetical protein
MGISLEVRRRRFGWLLVLPAACGATAACADAIAVQCTVEKYASSFAPRPGSFTILVDVEARSVNTYFGAMRLTLKRREIYGGGPVGDGWQSRVSIDRNTGRFSAGADKLAGRKHSFAELSGMCILPPALQGSRYGAR